MVNKFFYISAGTGGHLFWVEHPFMHGGDHIRPAGQEGLELGEVGEGEEESEADGRPPGFPAEPGGGRGSGGGPSGWGPSQHQGST